MVVQPRPNPKISCAHYYFSRSATDPKVMECTDVPALLKVIECEHIVAQPKSIVEKKSTKLQTIEGKSFTTELQKHKTPSKIPSKTIFTTTRKRSPKQSPACCFPVRLPAIKEECKKLHHAYHPHLK